VGVVTYPTLEHIAQEARPYPAHLLEGCETGLLLFAAAFLGHNDAIHFAEAGMRCVCIDTDAKRLREMRELYPEDWTFLPDNAWHFANVATGKTMFDAVSVDTFTGDQMRRSLESLELWCSLARDLVTVTITDDMFGKYDCPERWQPSLFHRANDVHWLVLTR
jgi:hypothetical protein